MYAPLTFWYVALPQKDNLLLRSRWTILRSYRYILHILMCVRIHVACIHTHTYVHTDFPGMYALLTFWYVALAQKDILTFEVSVDNFTLM